MSAVGERAPVRLYEQVAGKVREMILQRTFRAGDRLPSVRDLSKRMGCSVTTVIDAYRLLEDQGLIHPRAQSGHYVRTRPLVEPAEPDRTRPLSGAKIFDRDDLLTEVLSAVARPDVMNLAVAHPNPELVPHAKLTRLVASVARDHPEACYAYSPVAGDLELREQIAQRAFAAGCSVSPDEILITAGCQEALSLSLATVCRPGGVVAVESPTYHGVLLAIQLAGLRALEIPTSAREGICIDALRDAIESSLGTPGAVQAVLVTSNYNNPLGGQLSALDKQRLVAVCSEHRVPLIEDDVYGDLGFEEERPSVAKAYDEEKSVLLCSSFSKTMAPGYRVGWVIAGKHFKEVQRRKYATSVCSAGLPQRVIAEFLSNGGYDHYLRRARKAYATSVGRVADAIARYFPAGTKMSRPLGGFVLWVELPQGADNGKLFARAAEAGIVFAPGPIFTAQDSYRNCLRITASQWSPDVEGAIARLGRLAERVIDSD